MPCLTAMLKKKKRQAPDSEQKLEKLEWFDGFGYFGLRVSLIFSAFYLHFSRIAEINNLDFALVRGLLKLFTPQILLKFWMLLDGGVPTGVRFQLVYRVKIP